MIGMASRTSPLSPPPQLPTFPRLLFLGRFECLLLILVVTASTLSLSLPLSLIIASSTILCVPKQVAGGSVAPRRSSESYGEFDPS